MSCIYSQLRIGCCFAKNKDVDILEKSNMDGITEERSKQTEVLSEAEQVDKFTKKRKA
jgi:hypothetical protein